MATALSLRASKVRISFGNIEVTTVREDKDLYSLEWRSKMTNVVTKFSKMGGKYFCGRYLLGEEYEVDNMHVINNSRPAIHYFFVNTDLFKQTDNNVNEARKYCGRFMVKNDSEIFSIRLTSSKKVKKMQSQLGRKVLVGRSPETAKEARLVDIITWKNIVVVQIGLGDQVRLSEVPMRIVWFE